MMKQTYNTYSNEDREVWETLFSRQVKNLDQKAHGLYFDSLKELEPVLNQHSIPRFDELNETLLAKNGWSIEVVPGMIPVDEFFTLLAKKKFCSSTWLRSKKQLDYLEEPDMFHDIFGHIPLLMDPEYADFVEEFGKLGIHYKNDQKMIAKLQRLYWYTIEFGIIKNEDTPMIYGAGIISSFGESQHIYSEGVNRISFDIDWIFNHDFINSEIQNVYVEIESLASLYHITKQIQRLYS